MPNSSKISCDKYHKSNNGRRGNTQNHEKYHDVIVIGAGAAGLCFGAGAPAGKDILILEKTNKIGTKLLMSGSGQCNITHSGSIKEFLLCYGPSGPALRSVLYKHNNSEFWGYLESLGVSLIEREDGKVFPASLNSRDVRDALLKVCRDNGVQIRLNSPVTQIRKTADGFVVTVSDAGAEPHAATKQQAGTEPHAGTDLSLSSCRKEFFCRHLVIACGGCSYPSTGSDGSIFPILSNDLGVRIKETAPALVPVSIQNYPFAELSGISFHNISMRIFNGNPPAEGKQNNKKAKFLQAYGDLLFTHRNLSGPVILNNSRYMTPGSVLEINYVFPHTEDEIIARMKSIFRGNSRQVSTFFSEEYGLPKRFVTRILELSHVPDKKLSSLSGSEITVLSKSFTRASYSVSGLGGFNTAMVTKGGVDLDEVNLKTMESRNHKGLFFIGEVLDVDGDTGGYNLQFAYSSAHAALDCIFP